MSTTPQKVIVNGELQVICTTVSGETRGAIRFIDAALNQFGQVRAWGQYPFARLIIDSAGMSSGCAFKVKATQGSLADGGSGEKYAMEVSSSGVNATTLSLYPATRNLSINIRENGQPILEVGRPGTIDYVPLYSYLSRFTQDRFKTNENLGLLSVGRHSGTNAVWGLVTPGGDDPTLDYFYLAGATSTSVTPTICMTWNTTGDITMPHKLTAGTVTATTYENLPAVDFLPLTLDKVNQRVGINQTTPDYAFDVSGAIRVVDGDCVLGMDQAAWSGLYFYSPASSSQAFFDVDALIGSHEIWSQGNLVVDQEIFVSDKLTFGNGANLQPSISHGTGVPATTPDTGSLYLRSDGGAGTALYVKEPDKWVPIAGSSGLIANTFPKVTLTSTFVAYGDSYTEGGAYSPTWVTNLSWLTGKTAINKGKGFTTSDYATLENTVAVDPITNAAYANYTSVVMYGFNDVRNTYALYTNYYAWTQNILALALQLAVPQNKINIIRGDATWTKSGNWSDWFGYSFGQAMGTNGGYIEKNFGTVRYIAVRHTIAEGAACDWRLSVNGTLRNTFAWTTDVIKCNAKAYRAAAYVVDLGEDVTNCTVRLTNNASGHQEFVDFVATWTDAEAATSARSVLFLSIPRFNAQYTGAAPFNETALNIDYKRAQMNEGMEEVARLLRRCGLPVSFFRISEMQGNMFSDNIHPSSTQSRAWAKQMIAEALL